MKIINQILISERVRKLDFNSEQEFIYAINSCSYPEVDCDDVGRVQKFQDILNNEPKVLLTDKTIIILTKLNARLKILGELGK